MSFLREVLKLRLRNYISDTSWFYYKVYPIKLYLAIILFRHYSIDLLSLKDGDASRNKNLNTDFNYCVDFLYNTLRPKLIDNERMEDGRTMEEAILPDNVKFVRSRSFEDGTEGVFEITYNGIVGKQMGVINRIPTPH